MCLLFTALRPVSDVKINYDLNWKFEETNCKLLINYKNTLIFLSKLLYMTVLIIFDSKGESKWMLWQPSMQGRTFEYIQSLKLGFRLKNFLKNFYYDHSIFECNKNIWRIKSSFVCFICVFKFSLKLLKMCKFKR